MSDTAAALAKLTALPPQGMVSLRADFSQSDIASAIEAATGLTLPAQRGLVGDAKSGLGWMSPDELMVFCPHAKADAMSRKLSKALKTHHSMVANVSDARAVFVLQGPGVREVIAKLAPVDMAPDRMEPGLLRRTRLAQVPAAFWMETSDRIRLICFRSVARYVEDLLAQAARPGTSVGHF